MRVAKIKIRDVFLAALLLTISASVSATDAPSGKECTEFRFNLDDELQLFAGKPQKIEAAPAATAAPAIKVKELYEVALTEQSAVRFGVQPDKSTVAEGSYAGILTLNSTGATTLRVTTTEAAWIDVVSDGRSLESTRHTGSEACKLLRKSVEFSVQPHAQLLIQISGSTAKNIKLAVTSPLQAGK